jgi:hypothetical protein
MFSKIIFVALVVAFSALLASAADYDATVIIESGASNVLGVYFPGEKQDDHFVYNETLPEHLLGVMQPNTYMREGIKTGTGIVIRSSDMQTRIRVDFGKNPDKKDAKSRPFTLSFYNLAFGDRTRDAPVELQHGSTGYIWIEGGHVVTHSTDMHHIFTLRDGDKNQVFSVALQEYEAEL